MITTLSNFQQRLIVAPIVTVTTLSILFYSHVAPMQWVFVGMLLLLELGALREYYRLASHKGMDPEKRWGFAAAASYTLFSFLSLQQLVAPSLPLLAVALCAAAAFVARFKKSEGAIASLATTFFGVVYIALPLTLVLDLNYNPTIALNSTPFWVLYLVIVTKMTDISAYFAGKGLGRHLLTPKLSPKKTFEGALGGIAGAVIASIALTQLPAVITPETSLALHSAVLLGVLMAIAAQIGDLAESLLKRDLGVKDSSSLPGLGGLLDVADSLIFTTPLLYFWMR